MVKLRLTRTGRKNSSSYRVIAIDSKKARDSKALDYLGFYSPHSKELKIDAEKVTKWMAVGAQPSSTVKTLLIRAGVLKADKSAKKTYTKKPGQKSTERAEAKAAKAEEAKNAAENTEAEE